MCILTNFVSGLNVTHDKEPTDASSIDTSSTNRLRTDRLSTDRLSTDTSKLKESTGFDGQRIIYTVIGCAMTVVIIICMSFMYVFFKLNKRISMSRNMELASLPPSQSVIVPEEEDEVVQITMLGDDYEEIDETNLVNDNLNIIDESETDSNSASTTSPTEDDEGYLHPYHSLVHLKKMSNIVLDEHLSETDLRVNVLLPNPYDHLQIPIKIPTTSGIESMEMKERSSTNSNKRSQELVDESNVDPSCSMEETSLIRIYAQVERENIPAQDI
ncbi:Hypothetical predicted protein [Mytilus galloprovincialis]|uniref:Uncharacterized protein n=1 Tax=Mytilus galloprovincialis TaxID=29158 RepID=A0A8B6F8N7_MYTGA|nr:Hypothetical predicted protein [Mytilus galloprovincialis]